MKIIGHIPIEVSSSDNKSWWETGVPEGTWVSSGGIKIHSIFFCVGQRFLKVVCEKN